MLHRIRQHLLLIVSLFLLSQIQCATAVYDDDDVIDGFTEPTKNHSRKSYCVGSTDGLTRVGYSGNFELLRRQYAGCKIVFGHVIISHVDKLRIGNRTDEEVNEALNFLNDIEQITGSLIIFKTQLKSITFKNLKVIWGDELQDGMALMVDNNYQLRRLSFPSLRSIERGNVALNVVPFLCHWQKTVSMYEILGNNHTQRVFTRMFGDKCDREPEPECHPSCGANCFSSKEEDCQTVYRKTCPKDCRSGMCHFTESKETICCDEACAAGCTGKGSDHCVACKRLYQDGQCVDRCNGLTSYDVVKMMVVPHKNPRYAHNRFCVARCPSSTYIENENCVHRCSPGLYYDTSVMPYTCKPCKNGICPKRCVIEEAITAENIEQLRGCTTIEGHLYLAPHSFGSVYSKPSNEINKSSELTIEKLEILNTVRVVTDYVEISVLKNPLKNLSFLRNLEVIIGQKLRVKYALKIFANYHLQYLGLTSLKKISGGRVYISTNPKLCFADTLNETWNSIVLEEPEAKYNKYRIEKNRNKSLCQTQGMICHETCDKKYGCWGPGNSQCAQCRHFFNGKHCIDECPAVGYFIVGTNCSKCAPECVSCRGPLNTDCDRCKNATLNKKSGFQCLTKCPITHYSSNGTCLECHAACYNFGCSGSSDFVGKGGCDKCQYAIEFENGTIRCLAASADPSSVCKDNRYSNYFIHVESSKYIQSYKCSKCPDECLSCSGFGTDVSKHECECAGYKTFGPGNRTYCTSGCKDGTYLVQVKTSKSIGICRQCHELCDLSYNCSGSHPNECERCKYAAVIENNQQICLGECPEGMAVYQDPNKLCYNVNPAEIRKRKKQVAMFGIVFGVVFFTAIALGFGWNCWKYKTRYKQEKQLNPPTLPECDPIDPSAEPNMNQLRLISIEHLKQTSKPLGKGAFGVVYAGYWWPNTKSGEKVVVAIKVVQDSTGEAQKEMLAEAGIMASMRHPHLLRLVGVCLSNGIQLVTPLRPLGSLRDFLQKHRQKLGARDLLLYCFQIATAMEYLFKHRLVHRDLAARNVLVKRTDHVEVTDFGLAKMLEKGRTEIKVEGKVAVRWLALECLRNHVYNHWTDVWAFGVTCWEIITFGHTPYSSISLEKMLPYLDAGNRLEQPNNCSQEVYQVLIQFEALGWLETPESRPTFVLLKEYFDSFCRAPHRYIVLKQDRPFTPKSINCENQRELISELIDDTNFLDPLEYFDAVDEQVTECTTVPLTPITSALSSNSLPSGDGCGTILLNRHNQRLTSTDSASTRYRSEPVHDAGELIKINTDEGNYLVPNTKQSAALYTPVLYENSETEQLESDNRDKGAKVAEYNNDPELVGDKVPMVKSIANKEYFATTETSL